MRIYLLGGENPGEIKRGQGKPGRTYDQSLDVKEKGREDRFNLNARRYKVLILENASGTPDLSPFTETERDDSRVGRGF